MRKPDIRSLPGIDRRKFLGGVAGTAVSTTTASEAKTCREDQPNILLINCDDLGQRLESYGISTMETPTIKSLADDGVRFENAITADPSCSSSRSALATGRYPHSNGMHGLAHDPHKWRMHRNERHFASYLKKAGYETHIFGKFHVAREGQEELNEQTARELGFDGYHQGSDRSAKALGTRVNQFLTNDLPADPWFLMVNFHQPHRISDHPRFPFTGPEISPSNAPVSIPNYLPDTEGTRRDLADFRAAVREIDKAVNQILITLENTANLDNTLIIFTADQGISMPRSKPTLFEPSLEIPLIIRWPAGGVQKGCEFTEMVSNIDIMPTLLQATGQEVPDNVQGQSLLPLIHGEPYENRKKIFAERTSHTVYNPVRTIRTDRFKLIRRFAKILLFQLEETKFSRTFTSNPRHFVDSVPSLVPPRTSLYDLKNDPTEQRDLAQDPAYSDVKNRLEDSLHDWMRKTQDPILSGPIATPYFRDSIQEFAKNQ